MRTVIFLLFLIPVMASAQLSDNFSDGDFTDNPEWWGNTSQFIANAEQELQLNSSGEGLSYLSTGLIMNGLTEWRILTKLALSPSANNFARIYLVSDQQNVTEPLNGNLS